jgi:hypothetical protein
MRPSLLGVRTPPETAFEKLICGRLTQENRDHINAVRETLGLKSNDAVWSIFLALEYYLDLYRRFPPMIRAAAEQVLVEYKTQTDKTLATSKEAIRTTADELKAHLSAAALNAAEVTQYKLCAAMTDSAKKVAREAQIAHFWPWLVGGAISMALALTLSIGVAFGYGRYAGYTQGYTEGWREAVVRAGNQDVESGAQR